MSAQKNRLDWNCVFSLREFAKRLLRQNEIPSDLSQRELEIIADAKVCEKCGAVYSIHDAVSGVCPCCTELSERVEVLESKCDKAEIREYRLEEKFEYLADKHGILKSKLENIKSKLENIKTIIETNEEE